jgi:hypothetical protein
MAEGANSSDRHGEGLSGWQLREHFASRASHELDLIAHRMSWLVTSQSFLFIAWVASGRDHPLTLPLVISVVGIGVSVTTYVAIGAALRVLDRISALYLESVELALQLPPMGLRRLDPWTLKAGQWPSVAIAPMFIGVWTGAAYRAALRAYPVFELQDFAAAGVAVVTTAAGITVGLKIFWRPGKNDDSGQGLSPTLRDALKEHAKR